MKKPPQAPKEVSKLDELNQWLANPILRKEAMAKVMNSERYTVEFDENGQPVRVTAINNR